MFNTTAPSAQKIWYHQSVHSPDFVGICNLSFVRVLLRNIIVVNIPMYSGYDGLVHHQRRKILICTEMIWYLIRTAAILTTIWTSSMIGESGSN